MAAVPGLTTERVSSKGPFSISIELPMASPADFFEKKPSTGEVVRIYKVQDEVGDVLNQLTVAPTGNWRKVVVALKDVFQSGVGSRAGFVKATDFAAVKAAADSAFAVMLS